MNHIDGRSLSSPLTLTTDVVIVGSGPAGAAAAREAVARGARVVVLEAGRWFEPGEHPRSAFDAMALLYRDMSASVVIGRAPMPYIQGKMVGGSSPINGAICWRLPRDVHEGWLRADPALGDALPWAVLEALTDELEERLHVRPTDPAVAGPKNLLMARGAEALGIEHRPIRRNVSGCEGSGRCIQGCPTGRKRSVDVTLLADALDGGATLISSVEAEGIEVDGAVAQGVRGLSASGARVRVVARQAVIVAASAVQSPVLLLGSGLRHGPVGQHFQCHPGVSMAGRFPDPVRMWEGATQGHEVIGLRGEGLKFEALGFGLGVLAGRLDGVGSTFARELDDLAHQLDWGVAVKAEAHGRVRRVAGRTVVTWSPTDRDVAKFRRGLRVLGEMMLAAGADHVAPGVRGFTPRTASVGDLIRLEQDGPTHPMAFTSAITHMFGTCRMGSDAAQNVVRPDLRHHTVERLFVADSSVFPTNLGVNPQLPIMAVATVCARRALGLDAGGAPMAATPRRHPHIPEVPMAAPSIIRPVIRGVEPALALTLEDLMGMNASQLHAVLERGHALDPDTLAGRQYLGVDLSLPELARKVLWHTFRKTFVRDEDSGEVRGWNVKMEQHGIDGARIPRRSWRGEPVTFGHYRVRSAAGQRFPRQWRGAHFLDYTTAGNLPIDPAGLGFTPLVAVNAASQDLLLGWEVFKVGPAFVPTPLYWALRYEGPVEHQVAPPRPARRHSA